MFQVNVQQIEQIEEAKLKAKYPAALRPGGPGFLQKRLNRGVGTIIAIVQPR